MATGDAWYVIGPLSAIGLVGLLGAVFSRMGLQWTLAGEPESGHDSGAAQPAILAPDDYGLLATAAITDGPAAADEIRRLLGEAGIRATRATAPDGHTAVLVFAEELDEARRLVGDTPAV